MAANSITLSGSVPSGSVVDSYEVTWQRDTSLECPDVDDVDSETVSGDFTEYTINGLEEDSSYIITVTVFNAAGSSEDTVTAMTEEAGERGNSRFTTISFVLAAVPAAPTSVSIASVTSSSITVQWEMVPCIHRNGDITGYSVQYEKAGTESTQTMSVIGGATLTTSITGLILSTNYSIRVAAKNSAGTGDYSDHPVFGLIPQC